MMDDLLPTVFNSVLMRDDVSLKKKKKPATQLGREIF